MAPTVPLPRVAPESTAGESTGRQSTGRESTGRESTARESTARESVAPSAVAAALAHCRWYERVLGWPAEPGPPAMLPTGGPYDVLDLPAVAGAAVLRRSRASGPVALAGRRMRFLVAPGSAEELPGLLDWLEWGGVALDLGALGAGGRMAAPPPPGWPAEGPEGSEGAEGAEGAEGPCAGPLESPQGVTLWLRPPEPGCETRLPSLAAGRTAGPDLVRLVGAAATECHRAGLAGLLRQPLFS
ncbi:SCO3374 family protein [Streptomyces sp. NPDC048603]|uniref:SCO3374 family protein n=1 Tax=Streptomyces sp. NPDC048603 TaxID=3365577 RepID=UPI00371A47C7